jgi:hypothetical protein
MRRDRLPKPKVASSSLVVRFAKDQQLSFLWLRR